MLFSETQCSGLVVPKMSECECVWFSIPFDR